MSLVNSLAIGDADPARVVEGLDQTLISSTGQNNKRFSIINLKSFENRRGDPLKGFGELDFLVAADAARVVGPLGSALGVVFTQVALRPHHLHGCALLFEHRRDVQECVRVEPAELGLVRFKQKGRMVLKALATPAPEAS